MKQKNRHLTLGTTISIGTWLMLCPAAFAQIIPGPADVGRIRPEETLPPPDHSNDREVALPSFVVTTTIPEAAKEIHFILKEIRLDGMTAFTAQQLADIYAPYMGREVTLDVAWMIAGAITERYRNAGYFLSRAYLPPQEIDNGVITIKVTEGYVGKVDMPEDIRASRVVRAYISRLLAQRPLTSDAMERFLLLLNDLPGYAFSGTLSPLEGADEGAVRLTLVPVPKESKGSIGFDNYSSRYLGPSEFSASYSTSLLPLQQTTLTGLSSAPVNKLRYGTVDHSAVIAPDLTLDANGGVTEAYPGFTLKRYDIDSTATSAGVALIYQWIRQRQENLSFKLDFDERDVISDILHTPLTRDYIRAVRASVTGDLTDRWQGYNTGTLTVSQGINGLGSSQKGDLDLSRAQARPDFAKFEWSLSRLQGITNDWAVQMATAGQLSSGTLYSSEEFGYGGQAFGRAYDSSDITGDRGVSGSLELRYNGYATLQPISLQPYAFYDIGEVWNDAIGQVKSESGASAGLGIRGNGPYGLNGNLGLAWPLTREIATPLYPGGKEGPRILLQVSKGF